MHLVYFLLLHCCCCHGCFCVFSNIPSVHMARQVSDRVDLILELIVYSSKSDFQLDIQNTCNLRGIPLGKSTKCVLGLWNIWVCVCIVSNWSDWDEWSLKRGLLHSLAPCGKGRKTSTQGRTRPRTLFGCYGDANIQMQKQRRRTCNVAELWRNKRETQ